MVNTQDIKDHVGSAVYSISPIVGLGIGAAALGSAGGALGLLAGLGAGIGAGCRIGIESFKAGTCFVSVVAAFSAAVGLGIISPRQPDIPPSESPAAISTITWTGEDIDVQNEISQGVGGCTLEFSAK